MPNLTSLRTRLLVPLILAAVLSSIVVALGSAYLGRKWATEEMRTRYSAIQDSLRETSFPLTNPVIESLALLTSTDWIIIDRNGRVVTSTIKQDPAIEGSASWPGNTFALSLASPTEDELQEVMLGPDEYFAGSIQRSSTGTDSGFIQVLFDKRQMSASSRRAALPPLLTGLSTICLITLLMLAISSKMVSRLQKLEHRVGSIAKGNFMLETNHSLDEGHSNDEIGRLFVAVHTMADQLAQLWEQVHRQESAKMLHQIAAGMAHQLRNTLTGAKIAMELHSEQCIAKDRQDVQVALRQLSMAEDYVTRLTALGTDTQNGNQPVLALESLRDVESIHEPISRHLGVDVKWNCSPDLHAATIADGPAFSAAISNLLINAMQAALQDKKTHDKMQDTGKVRVNATLIDENQLRIRVVDNGPGINPDVADNLFEPFVTTKPEGMGLGLALVQRVAEQLGGNVSSRQQSGETIFEFVCQIER